MSLANASLKFLRSTASNKVVSGQVIINGISDHADLFPNLPIPLASLQAVNTALQSAAAEAKMGGRTAIITCKNTETEWMKKFKETAEHVSYIAKGNTETISKAGYTPTKADRKRKLRAGMVQGLQARPGLGKGTCIVSCAGQQDVNGYVCVAAPEGVKATMNGDMLMLNVNWETIYIKTSGRKSIALDSLPSSRPICVSMFTFNSAGSGRWRRM